MSKISSDPTSLDIKGITDVLSRQLKSAKVLSLDCFDTLLWRKVSDPIEVFKDLQNHPLYVAHGINAESRRLAERKVRQLKAGLEQLHEITIEEIYRQLLPSADESLVEQFVRAEIEAEKRYLFAYEPMFALLGQAKRKGLKTALVSDMYIRGHHLQELVEACALKAGLKTNIDYYFTSADHRTTKGRDLFHIVARQLGVPTNSIVHAGDNIHADLEGARRCGVRGFHFDRFSPGLEDCMRKNAQLQRLLSNDHGETEPIAMSWHAIWSQLPRTNNTLEILGWYYLGPILLHYSHWLLKEVEALRRQGHQPKLVFMMRDGYLSHQCHQALQNHGLVPRDLPAVKVDISRFATLAINLGTPENVKRYLVTNKGKIYRTEMLRQLIGHYDTSAFDQLVDTNETLLWETFCEVILSPQVLGRILIASARNRKNFLSYIRQQVRPQAGETLVLADLGYAGTIQDQIQAVVSEAFGVRVEGRYLILREADCQQQHKSGLIDYRSLNRNSVNLLLSQIQTLEQLTVNDKGSLMCYTDDGEPVHEKPLLNDRQRKLKQLVQTAALDLARSRGPQFFRFAEQHPPSAPETMGLIGRFTLQPRASEIELYREFTHDINNGTQRMRWISNPTMSRHMLIRGGGISFNCDQDKMLANDLNAFGPHLSYFNFVKARLGLKFGLLDYRDPEGNVPCVINKSEKYEETMMSCFTTHDGYKIGLVRSSKDASAIGISFGLKNSWVQVHSVSLVDETELASNPNWQPRFNLISTTRVEGGRSFEDGIIRFESSDGFLYIDLTDRVTMDCEEYFIAVVFRPISSQFEKEKPSATEESTEHINAPIVQVNS